MIAIIDYGMGNLKSVVNAFNAIGEPARITNQAEEIRKASAIVLPGVGAFEDGMKNLRKLGILPLLEEEILEKKKPYFGICLGMQFLAQESREGGERSHEGGGHAGFGWIPGAVVQIQPSEKKYKVPHMGWNDLRMEKESILYAGLPEAPVFYFVHSFHLERTEENKEFITASCSHGAVITASIQKGNIFGVQFHPEKSQKAGLDLLKNFAAVARAYAEKTPDPRLNLT